MLKTYVCLGKVSQRTSGGGGCLPLQVLNLWVGYLYKLLSVVRVGNGFALGRQMPLTVDCNNLDGELPNDCPFTVFPVLLVKAIGSASWRNRLTQIVRLSWVCTRHLCHIQIRPRTQQAAALCISGVTLQCPSPHGETEEDNAYAYRKCLLVDKNAEKRSTVGRR